MTLAIIFALTAIVLLSALSVLASRRAGAISRRPYGNVYGQAPGARASSTEDRDASRRLIRGTR